MTKRRTWRVRVIGVLLLASWSAAACAQDTLWERYMAEGTKAYEEGRHAEAERWLRAALKEAQGIGSQKTNLVRSLENLAEHYRTEGRYAEAEPLYKRSLAILETVKGSEDPDVAGSLNNLAGFYAAQGRYAEAELLYKRALATWEKVLGPEYPYVAIALEGLARFYAAQGRCAEAEPLYKRSLRIWQKILGQDHPFIATRMEKYAALLKSMNREIEAAEIEARVETIRAKGSRTIPTR